MILVVEDTAVFRKFVCSLLGDAFQIPIWEADCGESALDLAEPGTVIITDVHMPGMGGLQLIRRLRADHECAGTPIVAMSAHHDPESVAAAYGAGADFFFAKPFDEQEFLETVRALVPAARRRRHARAELPPPWQEAPLPSGRPLPAAGPSAAGRRA